jgi:hypothetical protein
VAVAAAVTRYEALPSGGKGRSGGDCNTRGGNRNGCLRRAFQGRTGYSLPYESEGREVIRFTAEARQCFDEADEITMADARAVLELLSVGFEITADFGPS